jgi:signal transduction histidine kinase
LRAEVPVDRDRLRAEVLGANEQMEHLVRDLLVLAAADASGPALPSPPVDLDQLVLEEVARARAGASVPIDATEVSAAPARADADDVRRIVRNLLDNALAHAEHRVLLTVRLEETEACLDVVDDGAGVVAEDRERIFDRFYRADTARSREGASSGLGLAIARTLARRQGGEVRLVPGPAPGAHFRLSLPALAGTRPADRALLAD